MKKLRNFKCKSCHKIYEKLIDDDVLVITCECGNQANRMLSAPRHFGNTCGKSPSRR